ncbi:MAG TPA: ABC transporter ATP-binding protein [Bacillota bacterium]|nr:ABC transporter ATP-binding protein [Bacillota bacterium]
MLTAKNVSKQYDKSYALKDVSLTIPRGSCFGLVGPNGAGKSTLIKLIARVIENFEGTITYNDMPLNKDTKRKIGYVPQDICVEQSVTARQNLMFFGKLYNITGKELHEQVDKILSYVGLSDKGNDRVHTFSGGMKRRLNIGCALMNNPELLIMDEPTVGIDPQSRKYIFQMVEQLTQSGHTCLYASHYMEEVEYLCEDIAFIDRGEIIETGTVNTLLRTYSIPSIYIQGDNISETFLECYGELTKKKDGFEIITTNPLETMEHIIQNCRKKGISLSHLELMQPRLEDVFFSLTGNQLRDDS